MDCSEVRKRLEDYVMGDLPHVEQLRVELHLKHCVPCQHDRDLTHRFLKDCRDAIIVRDVRDDFSRLMTSIAESEARMRAEAATTKRKLRGLWQRPAAAALLLAAGLTLLHMTKPLQWFVKPIANAMEAVEENPGEDEVVPAVAVPFVSHRIDINSRYQEADHRSATEVQGKAVETEASAP